MKRRTKAWIVYCCFWWVELLYVLFATILHIVKAYVLDSVDVIERELFPEEQ